MAFIKAYVYWKLLCSPEGWVLLYYHLVLHKTLLTHQPPFRDLLLSNTSEYYLLSLALNERDPKTENDTMEIHSMG